MLPQASGLMNHGDESTSIAQLINAKSLEEGFRSVLSSYGFVIRINYE